MEWPTHMTGLHYNEVEMYEQGRWAWVRCERGGRWNIRSTRDVSECVVRGTRYKVKDTKAKVKRVTSEEWKLKQELVEAKPDGMIFLSFLQSYNDSYIQLWSPGKSQLSTVNTGCNTPQYNTKTLTNIMQKLCHIVIWTVSKRGCERTISK